MRMILILITLTSLSAGSGSINLDESPSAGLSAEDFSVQFYPVAPYYVGDILSARITYTGGLDMSGMNITLAYADDPENIIAAAEFSKYRPQAVLYWAIDTQEFPSGFLNLVFHLPDAGISWQDGVNLLPQPAQPIPIWKTVETSCCIIHYLSTTDAAEDILLLQEMLETEAAQVIAQFFPEGLPEDTHPFEDPLQLVLVPAVVGHGGFATDEAVMTYSHRNWAGTGIETLAHHEIVHVVDRLLNDGPRPSLIAEGLAVYLSGGHYREQPILERAAALLELDAYLPLTEIVDDFYAAQHETSYIEAGALVAYLVKQWGWEAFIQFYFTLPDEVSDSKAISSALMTQYGTDLAGLEAAFIQFLKQQTPGQAVLHDVRLTIDVYDTLRRYQSLAIPSAHFRTAWWPNIRTMRERGIVGDYVPPEKSPFNIIIESLFLELHADMENGSYSEAEIKLMKINQYLDRVDSPGTPLSHYALGWPLPDIIRMPFGP